MNQSQQDYLAGEIETLAARIGAEVTNEQATSVLRDVAAAIREGTPIADIWQDGTGANEGRDVSPGDQPCESRTEASGAAEPPLPEGVFGRIEIPGFRNNTGWVTEETRFGAQAAIVRDWDGNIVAEVFPGPGSRFVHLPTPLKRPEPPAIALAIEAPAPEPRGYDDDDDLPGCDGSPF